MRRRRTALHGVFVDARARDDDARHAAGARADATGRFQGRQEGVLQERVAVAGEPVPVGRRDVGDAFDDLVVDGGRLAAPRAKRGECSLLF